MSSLVGRRESYYMGGKVGYVAVCSNPGLKSINECLHPPKKTLKNIHHAQLWRMGACGNKELQNTERVRNSSELSIHLNRGGLIISYSWETHNIYSNGLRKKRHGAFQSGASEDSVVYNEQKQRLVQYKYIGRLSKDAVICSDRTQDYCIDYLTAMHTDLRGHVVWRRKATFLRTFVDNGIFSPACQGWGVHYAPTLSLHL